MRAIMVGLALMAALPAAASAQWALTLQGGVHLDRLDRPEQVYRASTMIEAFSARGEALTGGARATRWLTGHFGADLGVALANNRSWSGETTEQSPAPRKTTAFVSATPVFRLFGPDARLQLQLGAGPALVVHGGSGASALARGTDFGAAAMGDVGVRLTRRLHLVLGVQNYRFTSRFDDAGIRPDGSFIYPAGSVRRSEWLVLTGLRVKL